MLSYIGPGGALSAIGSFLALLAAVFLALLGFVWYPIKRMLRARKLAKAAEEDRSSPSQSLPSQSLPSQSVSLQSASESPEAAPPVSGDSAVSSKERNVEV